MSVTAAVPADLDKSVFSVHMTRGIDAPIEKVWETLTDLPKYHEWNPFVREMIITDASKRPLDASKQVLTPETVGKYLLMTTYIPPLTTKVFECVTTVDQDNYRLSWRNIDYPAWALRAERWQVLTSMDGTSKMRYETWEAFDGVLAYLVKLFIGRKLKQAFAAFADGLKSRCES